MKGMNEALLHGHTNDITYDAIEIIVRVIKAKMFEQRTVGELLGGKKKRDLKTKKNAKFLYFLIFI